MRLVRTALRIGVAATIAAGAVAVAATPAQAVPVGCSAGYTGTGSATWAYCSGGTGAVRAVATCLYESYSTTAYGGWAAPKVLTSYASCGSSRATATNARYELRN